MDRQKRLGEEHIGSLLIKFSIPAIIGMMVNALYNVVDRIFIGNIPNIGKDALTGVGVTLPIMIIIMAFAMLIGIGTATSISIRLGQGKKEEAEHLLGNAFILLVITGIILTIVGLLIADPLLSTFGASDVTLVYAKQFIQIIFIGTVFNVLGFGLNHSIRADGNPQIAMYSMLIGAILNTILEPIFIFVLHLGVRGGAAATVISQFISMLWILRYFTKGNSILKLRVKNFKLKKDLVLSIIAIGVSPFAMQLAASVVQVISNNALRKYGGDVSIAAMSIISSVAMIFLMPIFGINQGSLPIIGYNYGAKKYSRVKETVKKGSIAATAIVVVGFLFVEAIPGLIIRIFNSDAELIRVGSTGLRIFLFMLPVIGFQAISANYFQSIGKAKMAMFLSLLRQVILLIPLLIILPKSLGLTGVWLAGPISDGLSALITAIVFYKDVKALKE